MEELELGMADMQDATELLAEQPAIASDGSPLEQELMNLMLENKAARIKT